jgi:hypothetical protein
VVEERLRLECVARVVLLLRLWLLLAALHITHTTSVTTSDTRTVLIEKRPLPGCRQYPAPTDTQRHTSNEASHKAGAVTPSTQWGVAMPREHVQPPTERGLEKHTRLTSSVTRLSERRRISARIPAKAPPDARRRPSSLACVPLPPTSPTLDRQLRRFVPRHASQGGRQCVR